MRMSYIRAEATRGTPAASVFICPEIPVELSVFYKSRTAKIEYLLYCRRGYFASEKTKIRSLVVRIFVQLFCDNRVIKGNSQKNRFLERQR